MHTDFNETSPDKILNQDFLDEYNATIESIWWQIISLCSKMTVLEKVNSFRFDLFDNDYPRNHFWNLVISSFFESSILCIWRISIDNSNDEGITLNQLKNKIIQNIVNEEIKTDFKEKLKNLAFEKNQKEINEKIKAIRHNFIAHYNIPRNKSTLSVNKLYSMDFNELKSANSQIINYFDFLCFSAKKSTYTLKYQPNIKHPVGIDNRLDVERLLDTLVKESYFISGKEEIKEIWEKDINQLLDDDLEEINRYRIKFGYSVLRKTT
ncbi:MAG: hypothetical protein V1720_06180 [bacterium]